MNTKLKSVVVLFFLMLASAITALAQDGFNVIDQDICIQKKAYLFSNAVLECPESSHCIYCEDYYGKTEVGKNSKGLRADAFIYIPHSANSCVKTVVNIPQDYKFYGMYGKNESLIAIYGFFDKKAKKYAICTNALQFSLLKETSGQSSFVWNPVEIFSIKASNADEVRTLISVSANGSKAGVLLLNITKKGHLLGSSVATLDGNGEKESSGLLNTNFANRHFTILDFIVCNDGTADAAFCSFQIKSSRIENGSMIEGDEYSFGFKKKRLEQQIHIISFKDEKSSDVAVNTDFGDINSSKLYCRKDGTIVLAGYHANDKHQGAVDAATYCATLQRGTESININDCAFPEDYDFCSHARGNSTRAWDFIKVNNLVEFSNGNLALLGEQRCWVFEKEGEFSDVNWCLWGNACLNRISSDGTLSDLQLIRKHQEISIADASYNEIERMSYQLFKDNDRQLMLFTDDIASHSNGHTDYVHRARGIHSSFPKSCTSLYILDSGDVSNRKLLFDSSVAGIDIQTPLFIDGADLVAVMVNSESASLARIKLNR